MKQTTVIGLMAAATKAIELQTAAEAEQANQIACPECDGQKLLDQWAQINAVQQPEFPPMAFPTPSTVRSG